MNRLFWLSDEAWATIEPHLLRNQPGARRVDDRRVISGIRHVIRCGCPWRQCPPEYGRQTTVCNRCSRWSGKGHWKRIMEALVAGNWIAETVAMDASYVKAHRSAHGAKGGRGRRRSDAPAAARRPRSTP